MYTRDEILNYRCPRWASWPNLGLYMDQVISLLEAHVAGFYPDDQQKPITSTMINNYVKQQLVMPSKNKKYNRDHLAYLYIIFLLKPVFNLTDICNGISSLARGQSIEEGYDIFCGEIEAAISAAFGGTATDKLAGTEVTKALSLAFSYTMLARLSFGEDTI